MTQLLAGAARQKQVNRPGLPEHIRAGHRDSAAARGGTITPTGSSSSRPTRLQRMHTSPTAWPTVTGRL